MDPILNDQDVALLDRAVRSVASIYPSIPAARSNGARIAVLRATIGFYERQDTDCAQHRITLAKLRAIHPRAVDDYVVTYDPAPFLKLTPLAALAEKYINPFRGAGTWEDMTAFEMTVFALVAPTQKSFPAIIHVETLTDLLRAVATQERAAAQLAPDVLPDRIEPEYVVRNGAQMPNFEAIARRAQTLQQRADGRTTCYRCASVKPRKCACAVCGYRPRNAGGGE